MICWNILQASVSGILNLIYKLLFAFNDIIEQLASLHVLHNQEELFWSLNDLIKLDDARVTDQLQDVDLSTHSLNICHIDNFLFL